MKTSLVKMSYSRSLLLRECLVSIKFLCILYHEPLQRVMQHSWTSFLKVIAIMLSSRWTLDNNELLFTCMRGSKSLQLSCAARLDPAPPSGYEQTWCLLTQQTHPQNGLGKGNGEEHSSGILILGVQLFEEDMCHTLTLTHTVYTSEREAPIAINTNTIHIRTSRRTHRTPNHCTLPYWKQLQPRKLRSMLAPHSEDEAAPPPSRQHRELCTAPPLLTLHPHTPDIRDKRHNPAHMDKVVGSVSHFLIGCQPFFGLCQLFCNGQHQPICNISQK